MIVFDGVSLNSIAGIEIEDIFVSPISYEPATRPRAINGGSEFIRNRAGTRTVTITFALLNIDKIYRQKALMAISTWAKTDKEYKLELPGHPEHYLMAVCTAKPEPSLRQWWESKLRLVFTCFDNPYWNAKAEKTVNCGTNFFVLGDAPPLMRIEETLTNQDYARNYIDAADTSYIIKLSFNASASGLLVIDMNNQIITVGGVPAMQYYNATSKFIIPKSGLQKINGIGTIKYRERWQ